MPKNRPMKKAATELIFLAKNNQCKKVVKIL